jgi:DNA repair exonuclease SbcCD ATPase subunit
MIKKIFLSLSVVALLWSCGLKDENAKLKTKIDSLNVEIKTGQEVAATLQEVGVLLDSIDANRNLLRSNIIEGTSFTNYSERLKSINSHVKSTSLRIEELEASLSKAKSGSAQYASMVKKLKAELETRKTEMLALEESITKLKAENETLVLTVNQKETIISEKDNFIQVKEQELASMETEFKSFSEQSKLTEGDLYFAQAAALEEAAERTKLAPRKKKTTQQEALELYRKALQFGKQEAQEKITVLEKELS